jgi:hypothetical protein
MKTMSKFVRLEALAERLIEGTFARLFKNKGDNASRSISDSVKNGRPAPAADTTRELRLMVRPNVAQRWWVQFNNHRVQLGQPVVTVGRALDNDIVWDDPALSPYHAQLRWRDGRYHLSLLASQPPYQKPLISGDKIVMGSTTFTLVVEL